MKIIEMNYNPAFVELIDYIEDTFEEIKEAEENGVIELDIDGKREKLKELFYACDGTDEEYEKFVEMLNGVFDAEDEEQVFSYIDNFLKYILSTPIRGLYGNVIQYFKKRN